MNAIHTEDDMEQKQVKEEPKFGDHHILNAHPCQVKQGDHLTPGMLLTVKVPEGQFESTEVALTLEDIWSLVVDCEVEAGIRAPSQDSSFRSDVESAINRHSMENGSNTPDFILADYLQDCLAAYDRTVSAREKWYGRDPKQIVGLDPISLPPLFD